MGGLRFRKYTGQKLGRFMELQPLLVKLNALWDLGGGGGCAHPTPLNPHQAVTVIS